MQKSGADAGKPWCIAHRGARDEAPENTCTAFERALAYPIDGIEMDIQMSADGVPVIYHDATLWRVARRRARVADLTRAQLSQLDWGRWFHRDFGGEPLLTLERVLERFGGRTRLLLEIKSTPADRISGHAVQLTRRVVELLTAASHGLVAEGVFILSFDYDLLALAHRLAPRWHYVLNIPRRRLGGARPPALNAANPLWALCVETSSLSSPLMQWGRSRALRLFTYTCNTARQVRKARRLGVDAILSDRPGWLTRHLEAEGDDGPETLQVGRNALFHPDTDQSER